MLQQLAIGYSFSKKHCKRCLSLDYTRDLLFCVGLAVGLLLLLAVGSYSPFDPSLTSSTYPTVHIQNYCGIFGSYIAGLLVFLFGLAALVSPAPVLYLCYCYFRQKSFGFGLVQILGWLLFFVAICGSLQVSLEEFTYRGVSHNPGGSIGVILVSYLEYGFGPYGKWIVYTLSFMIGLILIVRRPLAAESVTSASAYVAAGRKHLTWQRGAPAALASASLPAAAAASQWPSTSSPKPTATEPEILRQPPPIHQDTEVKDDYIPALMKDPVAREGSDSILARNLPYEPPSTSLFKKTAVSHTMSEQQKIEFQETAEHLTAAFQEFHVHGKVIAIQPGPVVAVYEFQPEAGTKLSKVTGLIEDIALALKVDSIFIHPVSGKRALGVQVPNKSRETVYLGDIVNEPSFKNERSPLTFAMGKNLSGDAICEDLAKMPHLLVAGQTGSGKSVAINSLLCSLILKSKPEDVKMVLVDPKILELKIYEGIPHLLMPVITEAAKASLALKWACYEMDRRYKLMELAKVRQIAGFNSYWEKASDIEKSQIQRISEHEVKGKLPYIVVVIDELADLMLTAPKDVESSIQRLAQKARASGIHLVLATQRPSVDVITGVIKANLPCRLSFKVFSRGDSRTILDAMGAERLLGKGDMLFLKPGTSRLSRLQGAFLEDHEVLSMVESIKTEDGSSYDETAISWIEEEFEKQSGSAADDCSFDDGSEDAKWDAALAVAQKQGSISASYLQRSLKIGYNRAARIVEHMESQGLVGPADGSKPRKWLGPV